MFTEDKDFTGKDLRELDKGLSAFKRKLIPTIVLDYILEGYPYFELKSNLEYIMFQTEHDRYMFEMEVVETKVTLGITKIYYNPELFGIYLGYPPNACNWYINLKQPKDIRVRLSIPSYDFEFYTSEELVKENVDWLEHEYPGVSIIIEYLFIEDNSHKWSNCYKELRNQSKSKSQNQSKKNKNYLQNLLMFAISLITS